MTLGDSSFTPMGMSCVTHRRYRSTPITDIGVRDVRHNVFLILCKSTKNLWNKVLGSKKQMKRIQ